MESGTPKMSLFQLNTDKVPALNEMLGEDFSPATGAEKESMVATRKSVSYWRDAVRRFKANKVSMGALFFFVLILIFTFLGPLFIPYNYSDQYRGSIKLGPGEFSQAEKTAKLALGQADLIYSTTLMPGSLSMLDKDTTYWFKYKGTTYSFYNSESLAESIIMFSRDAADPLTVVGEADMADGTASQVRKLEYSTGEVDASAGRTVQLRMLSRICPHYFGTDSAGRDLMARCMYGGRISIIIGIVAALIVLLIGSIYGSISGLIGGTTDFIMMRVVDIIYSVPDVLIVLLLQVVLKIPLQNWLDSANNAFARSLSSLGVGIISIFITFACLYWVGMSRIVRGQVLQLKGQDFVTAATALGVPRRRVIKRHLLPNCVGQLVIATCLQIPSAIFLESFLSFLGLGVSVPMASLGSLCSDALETITLYPYRLMYPGVLLTLLVLSLNLIGDGVRDSLDPKLKK